MLNFITVKQNDTLMLFTQARHALESLRGIWYNNFNGANNPASGKVMQKCGMSYEGTLRRSAKSNVGIYDALVYAIVKD